MSNDRMWGRTALDEDIAVRVDSDGQLILSPSSVVVTDGALTDAELRSLAVAVSGPLTAAELLAITVGVIGPITDAQLRASAVPVSGPVTDAQLRASAVPVSGPLTDAALRATAVPVSGPLTDTQLRADAIKVAKNANLYAHRADSIGANGTLDTGALDITNYQVVGFMHLGSQAMKRDIYVGNDGTNWYLLSTTASLPANVSTALVSSVAGLYCRMVLTNLSGSTASTTYLEVTGR